MTKMIAERAQKAKCGDTIKEGKVTEVHISKSHASEGL